MHICRCYVLKCLKAIGISSGYSCKTLTPLPLATRAIKTFPRLAKQLTSPFVLKGSVCSEGFQI